MATKPSGSASARQRIRLSPAHARVDQDRHGPGLEDGERQGDEINARPDQQRQPRAAGTPSSRESPGDAVALLVELAEADLPILSLSHGGRSRAARRRRCRSGMVWAMAVRRPATLSWEASWCWQGDSAVVWPALYWQYGGCLYAGARDGKYGAAVPPPGRIRSDFSDPQCLIPDPLPPLYCRARKAYKEEDDAVSDIGLR